MRYAIVVSVALLLLLGIVWAGKILKTKAPTTAVQQEEPDASIKIGAQQASRPDARVVSATLPEGVSRSGAVSPDQSAPLPGAISPVKSVPWPGAVPPEEPPTQGEGIEGIIRPESGYAGTELESTCRQIARLKPGALTDAERRALRWFLFQREAHATARNNVVNVLRAAKDPELAGALVTQLRDLKQSALWRNYCVQHLALGYIENKQEPAVIEALFDAMGDDPSEEVHDVCLLQLSRLAASEKWLQTRKDWYEKAATWARRFLRDDQRPNIERISGIHAAGALELVEELPLIVTALDNPKTDLGVRKSAARVLGKLALAADEEGRKLAEAALSRATQDRNRLLRRDAEGSLAELAKLGAEKTK